MEQADSSSRFPQSPVWWRVDAAGVPLSRGRDGDVSAVRIPSEFTDHARGRDGVNPRRVASSWKSVGVNGGPVGPFARKVGEAPWTAGTTSRLAGPRLG